MGLTVKTLKDGQLGTTAKGVLYTVPDAKAAIIKNIRVVNTDTAERTFNLYYVKSGNSDSAANSPST